MNINLGENILLSVQAVWTHRFRSFLTVLGIVIGITSVVTVASLLSGVQEGMVSLFAGLGPDNIFVQKAVGPPGSPGMSEKERRRRPLKPEYAEALRRWCPATVEDVALQLAVSPMSGAVTIAKVPGYESDSFMLVGQTANYSSISPRDILYGRFFTPAEEQHTQRVAVIGSNVADALLPGGGPVGRPMMVDGGEYTVVGVFAKAQGGFLGENQQDNQIVIPMRTLRVRYPNLNEFALVAKARPGMREDALAEIEAAMRRIRQLPTGAEDDFVLTTPDQIIQQFNSISGVISSVAIAISALGLLVGGIGVMNIMLVSVTERTREVGVRKAIGARNRDIVGQFLVEAMALTGAGGLLGIVVAFVITFIASKLVPSLTMGVPLWDIAAGFTTAVAVGLFFGVWPAVKASRLDPVDALRYE